MEKAGPCGKGHGFQSQSGWSDGKLLYMQQFTTSTVVQRNRSFYSIDRVPSEAHRSHSLLQIADLVYLTGGRRFDRLMRFMFWGPATSIFLGDDSGQCGDFRQPDIY